MKKRIKVVCLILISYCCMVNVRIMASEPGDSDELERKLMSEDYSVRCGAISQLTETVIGRGREIKREFYSNKKIRVALINLFAKESKKELEGESAAECYSDLASIVASLKDSNAVPFLLENIINSDVEYFLAETRDPRIFERMTKNFYQEKDYPGKREAALKILMKMYKNGVLGETDKAKTKVIFREALVESDCYFKVTAIRAIVETDDMDVLPELQKIANSDVCVLKRKRHGKIVEKHPIRDEAQKALGTLRERHKGKHQQDLSSGTTQ